MSDNTIAIYCFIADYFKAIAHKEDSQRKMSDAEILTTATMAALYFHGNFVSATDYMKAHHGVKILDKSGFTRRLHSLEKHLLLLLAILAKVFKELNSSNIYVIDSFPVSVCHNIRIARSRLLQGEAYRGYCASKKEYFYGFKVQVIVTQQGEPVAFFLSAGSFADITAFQAMQVDLPKESELYADSAYTDYELEDYYQECEQLYLRVDRKSNSKRKDKPYEAFLKKHFRKRIETSFSGITNFFPKHIHAVTAKGFMLKIVLFLFAYACNQLY